MGKGEEVGHVGGGRGGGTEVWVDEGGVMSNFCGRRVC